MDEGPPCSVWIESSPGAYHASFSDSSKTPSKGPGMPDVYSVHAQDPALVPQLEPVVQDPGHRSARVVNLNSGALRFVGVTALVLLLGAVAYTSWPKNPLELFWSPLDRKSVV